MTDIEVILKSNNIDYSNISADDIKFIKEKLIHQYERFSSPIFNEMYDIDGEMKTFTFKEILNMLKSVVNSFTA